MSIRRSPLALLFLATLAGAAACSSSTSDPSGAGTPSGSGGGSCASEPRKDTYTSGLSKTSGGLVVKIMDATPAPPSKGTNVMKLRLSDAADNPVDGATITVTPSMPAHGHGSAVVPIVKATGSGTYEVDKVYLAMAGLWVLAVRVEVPGAAPQDVSFAFCLDG